MEILNIQKSLSTPLIFCYKHNKQTWTSDFRTVSTITFLWKPRLSEFQKGETVIVSNVISQVLKTGLLPSKNCWRASFSPTTSMVLWSRLLLPPGTTTRSQEWSCSPLGSKPMNALENFSFSFYWSEASLQPLNCAQKDGQVFKCDYKARRICKHAEGKFTKREVVASPSILL